MRKALIHLTGIPLVTTLVLGLTACSSLAYYAQSATGQWEVANKRQPIDRLMADETLSADLRTKLQRAWKIRDFASTELSLPDNDSYRSYADIDRPYVVWNVFAAPPYDTRLKQWCFPVAGCVNYKGFFSEQKAQDYAGRLQSEGLDTYVGGVAAYSTLGWFHDPLLNTFIHRSEARLAGLIFHELAHQQLYVAGDTAFNEAFATTVELEGVKRWLQAENSLPEYQAYLQFHQRQDAFVDIVTRARDSLQVVYQSSSSDARKQQAKLMIQQDLVSNYRKLKRQWSGYDGYDAWFAGGLNNAQLGSVTMYRDQVPALQTLLGRQGGDLQAFYKACADIAGMSQRERLMILSELADASAVELR